MLQLMIDASDENDGADKSTKASVLSRCPVHQQANGTRKHKLTSREIVDNSVVFLIAGFETTAKSISYSSYYLALNPDIQEKLQSEIDNYFEDNPVRIITPCTCAALPSTLCQHYRARAHPG